MKYSLIVAAAENNVIGNNDKLPWNIPEEIKRFKEITTNNVIVMGRKTFQSIGRALPKRQNLVITRSVLNEYGFTDINKCINKAYKDVLFIGKIEDIDMVAERDKEVFIIGGSSIYKQCLEKNLINKIYFSRIKGNYDGDAYFDIDIFNAGWKIVHEEDNPNYIFYKMEKA